MNSERAGSYILRYSNDFLNSYYTFTPHPLCRDVELRTDGEMISLLANAHRQLGLLEGACRYAGTMESINRLLLLKEAAASYRIDDNLHFTFPELFGIVRDKRREQRTVPVQNLIKAYAHGIGELNRERLTNKLIYKTHGITGRSNWRFIHHRSACHGQTRRFGYHEAIQIPGKKQDVLLFRTLGSVRNNKGRLIV